MHPGVRDPRLAFVHFLHWDEDLQRPVEVAECQPFKRTLEVVSRSLSTRSSFLPSIIRDLRTKRDLPTVFKLEKQVQLMGDQIQKQFLEVIVTDSDHESLHTHLIDTLFSSIHNGIESLGKTYY